MHVVAIIGSAPLRDLPAGYGDIVALLRLGANRAGLYPVKHAADVGAKGIYFLGVIQEIYSRGLAVHLVSGGRVRRLRAPSKFTVIA